MEEIYKNKTAVIVKMLVSSIFFILLATSFFLNGYEVIAFLLLTPVAHIIQVAFFKPALIINNDQIQITTVFGKRKKIENIHDYKLVISRDFLAFRKEGQNDIMVDRGWFDEKRWKDVQVRLRTLNFNGIIE